VENHLWAVVSLPAGVFNPYSGVKTSILFLDRNLAKRADAVLFVKIENDGFDLGAQRRPIEQNDLPEALKAIQGWKQNQKAPNEEIALAVLRKRLLESPDINLSGDRYRATAARVSGKWPMVKLGDVCRFMTGGTPTSSNEAYYEHGEIPWLVSGDIHKGEIFDCEKRITVQGMENSNTKFLPKDSVLIALNGQGKTRGTVALLRMPKATCNQSIVSINPVSRDQLLPEFLFYQLRGMYPQIRGMTGDNERSGLSISIIKTIQVALPPLAEQERLVSELEGYRKVIEAARQILAHYKPTFRFDPKWPIVELCEVIQEKPKNGYSGKPVSYSTKLKILTLTATTSGKLDITRFKFLDENIPEDSPCRCRCGDIYLQRGNTKELVGTAALFDVDDADFIYPDLMIRVRADEKRILTKFLLHTLQSENAREFVTKNARGAAGSMPKINQEIVERIPIPIPPLLEQRAIVAELEAERALVEANRELIARFEQKLQAKLAEIWGEEAAALSMPSRPQPAESSFAKATADKEGAKR